MSLFDNGYTEEFLLLVCKFNMTLEASETLDQASKDQYLCTIIWGELLRQFDFMSNDVEPEKQHGSFDWL